MRFHIDVNIVMKSFVLNIKYQKTMIAQHSLRKKS